MTDDKAPSAQPEIREKTAKDGDPVVDGRLDPERLRNLHKRHGQGALVRSGARVVMGFAALGHGHFFIGWRMYCAILLENTPPPQHRCQMATVVGGGVASSRFRNCDCRGLPAT